MDRDDLEGAIAAAKYFLELYPYAYNTGDLESWRAMSHPDCVFCQSVIENVEALHDAGGHQRGGDIQWESATAAPDASGTGFVVEAAAQQAPTFESSDGSSQELAISPGGGAYLRVHVLPGPPRWVVRGVAADSATSAP